MQLMRTSGGAHSTNGHAAAQPVAFSQASPLPQQQRLCYPSAVAAMFTIGYK